MATYTARFSTRPSCRIFTYSIFPQAQVQLCIVHLVRASLNYVSWKDRKEVAAALKPIYRAANVEQAGEELDSFISVWGSKYQAIGRLWREQWERVIPFFAFAPEIRKVIYTTNAVESLHMSLRKVIKNRGSFPSEESALKLLFMALRNVSAKWDTVQNWRQALNQFEILWGDPSAYCATDASIGEPAWCGCCAIRSI